MKKQFGRTMLMVMGVAVAAAVLSSIPAQAASPAVVAHGFNSGVGWFTPAGNEFVNITVVHTNTGYTLVYNVFDFGGGFSAAGFGSIPASSVNVSGGSVNTGKVTVTLNVNTCDVAGFTTTPPGPCGTFDISWVEMPASVGGSLAFRGDSRQTFPGGGTMVTNGQIETFFALTTGTALGFDVPMQPPTVGTLSKQTKVEVTMTAP